MAITEPILEAFAPADVEGSWAIIEGLTASMCEAANNEHWSTVVELAGERHALLQQHFRQFPVGPDNAMFYQRHLSAMLAGERELQTLATNARRQVMRESVQTNHNRKAMGAYLAG